MFYQVSTTKEVDSAGEQLILMATKSTQSNLNGRRYRLYLEKSGEKQAIVDKALSPNTDSAGAHSLRFYHQVQQWEGNLLDTLFW